MYRLGFFGFTVITKAFFAAIAKAFGEKTKPHPELMALLKEHFGTNEVSSPKFKMAHVSILVYIMFAVILSHVWILNVFKRGMCHLSPYHPPFATFHGSVIVCSETI